MKKSWPRQFFSLLWSRTMVFHFFLKLLIHSIFIWLSCYQRYATLLYFMLSSWLSRDLSTFISVVSSIWHLEKSLQRLYIFLYSDILLKCIVLMFLYLSLSPNYELCFTDLRRKINRHKMPILFITTYFNEQLLLKYTIFLFYICNLSSLSKITDILTVWPYFFF